MSLTAKFGNWIAETTATTGTGNITLSGALAANYATFSDVASEGDQIYYHIYDKGTDNQEAGIASVLAGGALSRTPQATLVSGVYDDTSPAAISLSGNSVVYGSATADTIGFISSAVQSRLPKDGTEPMTGELILSDNASNDLGAVPKQQLDNSIYITGRRNLIDNADFTIWQRGATISSAINKYTADRWFSGSPDEIVERIELSTASYPGIKREGYGAKMSFNVNSTSHTLAQGIELVRAGASSPIIVGETYTLSYDVLCTVNANTRALIKWVDDVQTSGNAVSVLDETVAITASTVPGAMTHISHTFTVSSSPAATNICLRVAIGCEFSTTNAVAILANVQLELGDAETSFEEVHLAINEQRCYRYFQVNPSSPAISKSTSPSNTWTGPIALPVQMRIVPTASLGYAPTIRDLATPAFRVIDSITSYPHTYGIDFTTTTTPSVAQVFAEIFRDAFWFDAEF